MPPQKGGRKNRYNFNTSNFSNRGHCSESSHAEDGNSKLTSLHYAYLSDGRAFFLSFLIEARHFIERVLNHVHWYLVFRIHFKLIIELLRMPSWVYH